MAFSRPVLFAIFMMATPQLAIAQAPRPGATPGPTGPAAPATPRPAATPAASQAEVAELRRQLDALRAHLAKIDKAREARASQRRATKQRRDAARRRRAMARKQLELKVDVLTEEVQKLREKLTIPESDKEKQAFGMGPAASKVYFLKKAGLSIGGYGEFYIGPVVKNKTDGADTAIADVYRYIQYVGFKFTDWLVMNAEIEIEHASTGTGGEVSVEFAYLDALLHKFANVRFGLMLIPMGYTNEVHEPPFYFGNLRPEVERRIIPSTWREIGAMVFGNIYGLRYKLFTVTGMNGAKFADSGWRSGRQKGAEVLAEDWAVGLRLDWSYKKLFEIGASFYYGEADHGLVRDAAGNKLRLTTILAEAHLQLRFKGLHFRALGVVGWMSNAHDFTLVRYPDALPPDPPEERLVASLVYGWYAEVAYDLWRHFKSKKNFYFAPFFRFENYNTQASTPTIPGRTRNRALNRYIIDAGLSFKPHPQVVLKVNYRDHFDAAESKRADSLYFGAGFVY